MKRVTFGVLALTLVMGLASPGWAAGLKLTIRDGRVSLDAQDVTLRQILTEWARVGKTRIMNLERVNSAPLTLKFDGLSEEEALDVILRTLPGYMAAPRATLVADASIYDRIVILPTTTAVATLPTPRAQTPLYQDWPANVTQLRPGSPSLNPGLLPEPQYDPRDANDPALAAAAAAGLIPSPSSAPGTLPGPMGPLQPPVFRGAGPSMVPLQPQQAPATTTPSNPWNAPLGPSMPGLAAPPPPQPVNPAQGFPVSGARPQPADQ
jgi:hypothetical protein